ncbi:hypothetical protein QR680_003100 [Steinernema hermaphroditum]|uniref:ARF7 effector protein C-terminal domain-containing protein n=1 Tax=Steinernema hermaphroditum TaxID=289476 RepID=A0AA39H6E5_9BILA|nr:hypothetical protein QR680_003100 [Steinernema hermaphroditum]
MSENGGNRTMSDKRQTRSYRTRASDQSSKAVRTVQIQNPDEAMSPRPVKVAEGPKLRSAARACPEVPDSACRRKRPLNEDVKDSPTTLPQNLKKATPSVSTPETMNSDQKRVLRSSKRTGQDTSDAGASHSEASKSVGKKDQLQQKSPKHQSESNHQGVASGVSVPMAMSSSVGRELRSTRRSLLTTTPASTTPKPVIDSDDNKSSNKEVKKQLSSRQSRNFGKTTPASTTPKTASSHSSRVLRSAGRALPETHDTAVPNGSVGTRADQFESQKDQEMSEQRSPPSQNPGKTAPKGSPTKTTNGNQKRELRSTKRLRPETPENVEHVEPTDSEVAKSPNQQDQTRKEQPRQSRKTKATTPGVSSLKNSSPGRVLRSAGRALPEVPIDSVVSANRNAKTLTHQKRIRQKIVTPDVRDVTTATPDKSVDTEGRVLRSGKVAHTTTPVSGIVRAPADENPKDNGEVRMATPTHVATPKGRTSKIVNIRQGPVLRSSTSMSASLTSPLGREADEVIKQSPKRPSDSTRRKKSLGKVGEEKSNCQAESTAKSTQNRSTPNSTQGPVLRSARMARPEKTESTAAVDTPIDAQDGEAMNQSMEETASVCTAEKEEFQNNNEDGHTADVSVSLPLTNDKIEEISLEAPVNQEDVSVNEDRCDVGDAVLLVEGSHVETSAVNADSGSSTTLVNEEEAHDNNTPTHIDGSVDSDSNGPTALISTENAHFNNLTYSGDASPSLALSDKDTESLANLHTPEEGSPSPVNEEIPYTEDDGYNADTTSDGCPNHPKPAIVDDSKSSAESVNSESNWSAPRINEEEVGEDHENNASNDGFVTHDSTSSSSLIKQDAGPNDRPVFENSEDSSPSPGLYDDTTKNMPSTASITGDDLDIYDNNEATDGSTNHPTTVLVDKSNLATETINPGSIFSTSPSNDTGIEDAELSPALNENVIVYSTSYSPVKEKSFSIDDDDEDDTLAIMHDRTSPTPPANSDSIPSTSPQNSTDETGILSSPPYGVASSPSPNNEPLATDEDSREMHASCESGNIDLDTEFSKGSVHSEVVKEISVENIEELSMSLSSLNVDNVRPISPETAITEDLSSSGDYDKNIAHPSGGSSYEPTSVQHDDSQSSTALISGNSNSIQPVEEPIDVPTDSSHVGDIDDKWPSVSMIQEDLPSEEKTDNVERRDFEEASSDPYVNEEGLSGGNENNADVSSDGSPDQSASSPVDHLNSVPDVQEYSSSLPSNDSDIEIIPHPAPVREELLDAGDEEDVMWIDDEEDVVCVEEIFYIDDNDDEMLVDDDAEVGIDDHGEVITIDDDENDERLSVSDMVLVDEVYEDDNINEKLGEDILDGTSAAEDYQFGEASEKTLDYQLASSALERESQERVAEEVPPLQNSDKMNDHELTPMQMNMGQKEVFHSTSLGHATASISVHEVEPECHDQGIPINDVGDELANHNSGSEVFVNDDSENQPQMDGGLGNENSTEDASADVEENMKENANESASKDKVAKSVAEQPARSNRRKRALDPLNKELDALQPDEFTLSVMSSGRGRVLRSAGLSRSKRTTEKAQPRGPVDSLTHDKDGRILNVFTGEMIYMCDCFDLQCEGCQVQCQECYSRRCYFVCQRGRDAYIWLDFTTSKRRNPFIRQVEDEQVEMKTKFR